MDSVSGRPPKGLYEVKIMNPGDIGGSGGTATADDADFTAATTPGTIAQGVYESTPTSVTDGDVGAVGITQTRALKVSIENDAVGIGGGTQYTEDAAAAADPVGNMGMAVRADSLAAVTSADGDNIALRATNKGELYVKQTDSVPVTDNGGSLTVDGTVAVSGTVAVTDNSGSLTVDNAALSVTGGGVEASALRVTIASDSTGVVSVDDNGSTISIDDGAGSITVDGSVTIGSALPAGTNAIGKLAANSGVDIGDVDITSVIPGTGATSLGKAEDAAHASGDTGVAVWAVRNDSLGTTFSSANGDYTPISVSSTGVVRVDPSGTTTQPVSGTVTASNAAGDVAHDGADSGNPLKMGGKAYAFDGTAPGTAVAEADRANFITDLSGIQYVQNAHPNFFHVSADYASAQTNASVKAAPGVGLSLFITDIMISNGATAGNVTLLDGSGGTVLFELYPAINGGATLNLKNPIKLTSNTALCITSTTVTTHSVFVSGFIA